MRQEQVIPRPGEQAGSCLFTLAHPEPRGRCSDQRDVSIGSRVTRVTRGTVLRPLPEGRTASLYLYCTEGYEIIIEYHLESR